MKKSYILLSLLLHLGANLPSNAMELEIQTPFNFGIKAKIPQSKEKNSKKAKTIGITATCAIGITTLGLYSWHKAQQLKQDILGWQSGKQKLPLLQQEQSAKKKLNPFYACSPKKTVQIIGMHTQNTKTYNNFLNTLVQRYTPSTLQLMLYKNDMDIIPEKDQPYIINLMKKHNIIATLAIVCATKKPYMLICAHPQSKQEISVLAKGDKKDDNITAKCYGNKTQKVDLATEKQKNFVLVHKNLSNNLDQITRHKNNEPVRTIIKSIVSQKTAGHIMKTSISKENESQSDCAILYKAL